MRGNSTIRPHRRYAAVRQGGDLRIGNLVQIAALIAASSVSGQNLLTNYSFTSDVSGWTPTGFVAWVGGAGNPSGSGPGCAELAPPLTNGALWGIYQTIPVVAGATYRISGWAFVPTGADNPAVGAEVAVSWLAGGTYVSTSFFATMTTRGQWIRISGDAVAPAGATAAQPQFGVRVPNGGTDVSRVRWDDVSFVVNSQQAELYVPAAGNNAGRKETYWTTDLAIHNPMSVPLTVEGAYLNTAGDNSAAPFVALATVNPGATASLTNVVATIGYATSGTVRLRCSATAGPVQAVITAHTTTPGSAGGSYGQGAVAETPPSGSRFAVSGLVQGAAFRTNVGVVNTTAAQATVRIRVLAADGSTVADVSWVMGPYGWRQVALTDLGVSSLDGGTLLVDGAGVIGYATPVDQTTGDSVYLRAQPLD